MYDIIKKQNGEHFAKAIRCYDNGIFDIPNLNHIVKYAGRDAEPIMKYLISLKGIEVIKQSKHHAPLELLARAGYTAYVADTLEKQNAISRYFAPNEQLCTFKDKDRFQRYYIINAVRHDADKLNRNDFLHPEREDAYGTSVISIQVLKEGGFISIKNRYNHTVESCDNTFNSNPDNIIMGLSDAIQNYFNVNFVTSHCDLPRGFRLVGDQICKYTQEINNVYIGENFYVSDGEIHDINGQNKIMLGGGLIFDIPSKTVFNVARPLYNWECIDNIFRGKALQQTKDRKTGVRTLTANGVPVMRIVGGQMTYINLADAPSVLLTDMNKLCGELDLSNAHTVDLENINTENITRIKFNPMVRSVQIRQTALPRDSYDFGNACTLILNNADFSRATEFQTKRNAGHIVISNVKFPPLDFDFSGVEILGLPNCDLSAVKSIKFNPLGYRINLRGAKLPAQKFDFSRVDDVILDNTDISLVRGINLNPSGTYTGITPADVLKLTQKCKHR